ncbi:DUF2293 domain-containing protein [Agrobacterium tumefaciens]|jgi:hypothetical protein|uniref:DUF2293 domain-containing protein n=1 Tax=Agrobacterium tumefaciens TaxID=358 RepID=UPI001572423D|nr:DUF2293 domain-containing protein [Agrobacterium tumefaciens]
MKSRREQRRERQRRRYKQWFHQYEVEYFIRRVYPACPEFAVVYFADQVCNVPKNWRDAPIAVAVEVTMQNFLRHQFTDYEQLLLVGVRRKEARRRVQQKIDSIVTAWKAL